MCMIVIWNKDKERWTGQNLACIQYIENTAIEYKIPFSEYLASMLIHLKGFFSAANYCSLF
jgi:hypothetical protein